MHKQTAHSYKCKINFVHPFLSNTLIKVKIAHCPFVSLPVAPCRVLTCACFTIAFACSCIQCMRGVCEREIIKCVSLSTEEQTHSPHGGLPRCSRCPCCCLPLLNNSDIQIFRQGVGDSQGCACGHPCMHAYLQVCAHMK